MDNKALYKLSYGVFMLATKSGDKINGCITNTCMQVASSPTRIVISCMNANYTCKLIKESGVFSLSLLDEECTFETIKHWGFQTGYKVDKMDGLTLPVNALGIPYLSWHTCAVISGKVLEQYDLGTHTMFVAEVSDAFVVNDKAPLTYADYQSRVKPRSDSMAAVNKTVELSAEPPEGKKIVGWKCRICDHIENVSELPDDFVCPICGHGKEDSEPIYG